MDSFDEDERRSHILQLVRKHKYWRILPFSDLHLMANRNFVHTEMGTISEFDEGITAKTSRLRIRGFWVGVAVST